MAGTPPQGTALNLPLSAPLASLSGFTGFAQVPASRWGQRQLGSHELEREGGLGGKSWRGPLSRGTGTMLCPPRVWLDVWPGAPGAVWNLPVRRSSTGICKRVSRNPRLYRSSFRVPCGDRGVPRRSLTRGTPFDQRGSVLTGLSLGFRVTLCLKKGFC